MATLRAYPNGLTMGMSTGGNPAPVKRGTITGWSAAAVRRHKRWLFSVVAPDLSGAGYALTLTVKDTPPSAREWHALRRNWIDRLERRGLVRLHWVVEWQKRGTPHLHVAAYFGRALTPAERWDLLAQWTDVAAAYGAGWRSQDVKPIDGPMGWLKYLSKHAARGVAHYQRQGKPEGWESTGRLWGYVGDWPLVEPIEVTLTTAEYYRMRRLVRAWRVADARRAGDPARIAYARRSLKCPDADLSRVRGVSEWVPESVVLEQLLEAATLRG